MFENKTTNLSVHISDYHQNLPLKSQIRTFEICELLKPKALIIHYFYFLTKKSRINDNRI
jgi:hypothetical protein